MPKTKAATVATPTTEEEWADLLRTRIEESGLSAVKFSTNVLLRDGRTVRRYLACDSPIPQRIREFLVEPEPRLWPTR